MRIFTTDKDRIALILAFAAILAQPSVNAQVCGNAVVADIPFAFQIDSYHLPPGRYTLETEGSSLLWVKGDPGSAVAAVLRNAMNKPSADSAVVFHHYGNQYFLREVRTAGHEGYLWSSESKAERRAKLEDAANSNSEPREDWKVEIALVAPHR